LPVPDIGGQSFNVHDPGPPYSWGDIYLSLTTLTDGATTFPYLSPTTTLFLAHAIEAFYLMRELAVDSGIPVLVNLGRIIPKVGKDLVNLQPSIFGLTVPHLLFDDSRARLSPAEGGLGYKGALETLEGMCRLVQEYKKTDGKGYGRSEEGGVGLGMFRAQKSLGKVWKGVMGGGKSQAH
jgi:hypothetical protein